MLSDLANLRVALAMRNARHRQVHTNLRALALEVSAQAFLNGLGCILGDADNVLSGPGQVAFHNLFKLILALDLATGALLGIVLALNNLTTNLASPLFHVVPTEMYNFL